MVGNYDVQVLSRVQGCFMEVIRPNGGEDQSAVDWKLSALLTDQNEIRFMDIIANKAAISSVNYDGLFCLKHPSHQPSHNT